MRKRRGMTLMEALISIAKFAMVMFLMANLMSAAAQSEKFLGQKDRVQEVALSSLYRMAHEARTANRWLTPVRGTSSEMVFETPDLLQETKEFPTATPYPASWRPADPKFQVTVRYFIGPDSQLTRTLTAGADSWTTPLVRDCQSLEVKRLGPVNLSISLTVLSNGAPKKNTLQVLLPQETWKPQ